MKQTSDEVCFTILFLNFLLLQREGGTGETGELVSSWTQPITLWVSLKDTSGVRECRRHGNWTLFF